MKTIRYIGKKVVATSSNATFIRNQNSPTWSEKRSSHVGNEQFEWKQTNNNTKEPN